MHTFSYQNGELHCEGVNVKQLAKQHGTPLYVYSAQSILSQYRRLHQALEGLDHRICYAVKANSNLAILSLLAKEGSGFDIVSGGELFRVEKAGGSTPRCTFAGVGKTEKEIEQALWTGIYAFNVESEAELQEIQKVASRLNVKAPVALRINPNVDADTHKYISTGKSENKFGIGIDRMMEAYEAAAQLSHIKIRGVQMHIGSQITKSAPFAAAVEKMIPFVQELKEKYQIEFFDIGGGIGIVYPEALESAQDDWWKEAGKDMITPESYAAAVVPLLKPLGLKILVEPGRFLVGNAGILVGKVLYEKQTPHKKFLISDTGMNDLIRPALYEGHHQIVPLNEPASAEKEVLDLVGPVCESGDFFAQGREISPMQEGDYFALMSAGAYGFTMASNYNSRPLPCEILVQGNHAHIIRTRQTFDDLIQGEKTL